ncbi:winged helix-turn-helix transcriptional regulator [Companilactobacillus halodurans]|uniref:Response regulator transcription factor n=1 Tax=Companilactobacillus halodurans TaxID=2584183 RepID=A0A5P0ZXA5_9LACO|nr:response regulator transcription factor [Companilactobacillus halodurans]MQS75712.1 response regulator transcription factor [Companilactobacillus halodurans]MQS97640.1 response regulator transcription factor [Companilactobacillus halodurans]
MQPLVLLSNRLPLFIEINSHFNRQGWFIRNVTDPKQVEEVVEEENIAGLLWDFSTMDIKRSLKILKTLRNKISGPIIVLAPAKEKKNRSLFYNINIDSFLTNPIDYTELVAKIKQLFWVYGKFSIRKDLPKVSKKEFKNRRVKYNDVVIDFKHYRVTHNGYDLGLTPKEFSLFWYLIQHRGKVMSREQLLEGVWGYDATGSSRTVDIHISHLRDKLAVRSKSQDCIKTVRGFGYVLDNKYPLVSEA